MKKPYRLNLLRGFCAVIFTASGLAAKTPTRPIRIASGRVSGERLAHGVRFFAGMPFAKPPVGRLRWRPPQPAVRWRGVRAARQFGHPCYQSLPPRRMGPWTTVFNSQLPPSEDCLYLNLWTPAHRRGQKLPVMVWIYGGGFTSGAGSVAIYNGARLARRGVIVVNFNYRVGVFGFLAYPELAHESPHHSAGNYGLLDQIAALRWVRRNIAAFGGNPRQVTIFGQSAGAASVWLLMQSPLARGLFQRAIIMSGPGALPFSGMMTARNQLRKAEAAGRQFADSLGAHSLAGLRQLTPARLLQGKSPIGFAPIADGWVLRSGWPHGREVPVINGMVADDIGIGWYGTQPPPPPSLAHYKMVLRQICGASYRRCRGLYPASSDAQAGAAVRRALRDRARVSLALWARRQLHHSPRVYSYYFDHLLPWPQHPEYGIFHSSEVPYVFDNLRLMKRPWQPEDHELAQALAGYWTNFGKNGNPNRRGLPRWPAFRAHPLKTMELGKRLGPMPVAPRARLALWEKLLRRPLGF